MLRPQPQTGPGGEHQRGTKECGDGAEQGTPRQDVTSPHLPGDVSQRVLHTLRDRAQGRKLATIRLLPRNARDTPQEAVTCWTLIPVGLLTPCRYLEEAKSAHIT